MSAPSRIRCRRTKRWRKPPGTKYVTRSGPWGNPFEVKKKGDPDEHRRVVALFRGYCKPELACHADVLLELANAE
ncbi:MAG: DUF4326 domain-containing protein [Planctomycetaceae bacterium]|nr:DUF4326 domain-containing protein [Planctomycetaceae bacterium]